MAFLHAPVCRGPVAKSQRTWTVARLATRRPKNRNTRRNGLSLLQHPGHDNDSSCNARAAGGRDCRLEDRGGGARGPLRVCKEALACGYSVADHEGYGWLARVACIR